MKDFLEFHKPETSYNLLLMGSPLSYAKSVPPAHVFIDFALEGEMAKFRLFVIASLLFFFVCFGLFLTKKKKIYIYV